MAIGQETFLRIPAGVDLHAHLREPGLSRAETIASGTRAALRGGIVAVCDMPNNSGAPTWSTERLSEKCARIRRSARVAVGVYAGSQPEADNVAQLSAMARRSIGLKLYGAATTGVESSYEVSDFGEIVAEWHRVAPDKPIMLHAGQNNLEDFVELVTAKHEHHLHVCHVHHPSEVVAVEKARRQGRSISCGVCPHHLLMTSHDVRTRGWTARMQPPLSHQADAEALMHLLAQGQIDVIESDHAPHLLEEKIVAELTNPSGVHTGNDRVCFGVPGIDLILPLMLYQVERGRLPLERLIDAFSVRPARIIGIEVSPNTTVRWRMKLWRIEQEAEPRWTPYLGMFAVGQVEDVSVGGRPLVIGGTQQDELPSRLRLLSRGAAI